MKRRNRARFAASLPSAKNSPKTHGTAHSATVGIQGVPFPLPLAAYLEPDLIKISPDIRSWSVRQMLDLVSEWSDMIGQARSNQLTTEWVRKLLRNETKKTRLGAADIVESFASQVAGLAEFAMAVQGHRFPAMPAGPRNN